MQNGHQGWSAQLSSGEWVYETGLTAPGELSAWQKLLTRCLSDNVRIVQLQLRRGHTLVSAMPRCEGYFQGYDARISNNNRTTVTVQGIGSVVGSNVFICWIDDTGHVSQEVRDLKSVWVHTTNRANVDVLTPRA